MTGSLETYLLAAQRPLLIAHIAPDGDAVGSLLGLGWALKEAGKRPTLGCADPIPDGLRFLPGVDRIAAEATGLEDLVVTLDCADQQRLGSLYDEKSFRDLPVLNIDHHVTNARFGRAQMVDPAAASTAQLVYELLRRLGWPIRPWIATCLLTGLITDTRSFRTSNTNADVLRTALALVEAGAPLAEVNAELEHGLSFGVIRLWGRTLSSTRFVQGVVWAEISQEMLRECGASSADNSGLVSFIAGAREAQVAALLTEREDGRIEVGMRAVPGVDVSAVALALGGGGHPQAAGCTLPGPMAAAREAVLERLAALVTATGAATERATGGSHATERLPGRG